MEESPPSGAPESLQCRLCLHTADLLISIFGKRGREAEMCRKLREHLKLTVKEDETLPKHICLKCWDTVEYIDSFVRRVERNQSVLVYGERGEITFIVSVAEPPVEIDETYDFRKDSADPPSYDEAQKTKQATAMYDEGEGEELIEIIEAPCEDTVSEEENLVYDLLPLDDDSDERTTAERDELREEKDPIGDGATTIVSTTDEEAGILVRVNDYDFPPMIKDGRMIVHGEELEKCLAAYYGLACELCHQRNWATIGELFAHHRAAHGREGFVNCCGRTIEKKSQMAMHMAKHVQPEAFECPICKKMMTTPRILKAHMQNHLPEEERPLKCDLCPRRFSYVSALLIHASTHREENEGKCAYHLCHSCGRAFRSGDKLAEHIALSHRTDGTSNCVMCDTCGKKFISKSNLNYHLTTHQPKVLHQVQCEHCGKWLKNKLCLRKHMLQHSQVRHACDQCDYTTINVQSLQNHRRVQHTDEKPFVCPTCGKSFKVKSNLREHLAQHRQGQKYSCEFCSRKFTSKSNYYCHRKRMHPNELELERRKKEQEESAHRIRLKLKLQRQ
ncbi:zinc finger protein 317 [Anopheles gambiae]|uniref:zinc finger protein 317 n=1 Tax=Anopheles gambiae TaxID=7165 RepID=UPI002AC95E30|nr:zinc finger protein 317 [Anopheles gambiae]